MFKRDIWDKIEKEITSKEMLVLTGPRQVGKTTTLKWILDQIKSPNKIYLDLEQLTNRDLFNQRNYDSVISELKLLGINEKEKIYIALDEIQLVENLPSVVKYLYDHYDVKFFLSGSSSYYLKNHFSESLAGRKIIFEMFPLNFREFLRFKSLSGPQISEFKYIAEISTSTFDRLKQYYSQFIEFGGMPSVVLEENEERKKTLLNEIFTSYITLDVETLSDFRSITDFRTLINLLANRLGNKLDITKLSQVSGLSRPTIYTYLEFLEQTYIIKLLEPLSDSIDVKTRLSKKVYFIDTGIANINADISEGQKFENTIYHQLSFYGDLNYFSNSNTEIDFILNKTQSFEVKVTPIQSDYKKLKEMSEKLNIKEQYLIGKTFTGTYNKFIYGGLI